MLLLLLLPLPPPLLLCCFDALMLPPPIRSVQQTRPLTAWDPSLWQNVTGGLLFRSTSKQALAGDRQPRHIEASRACILFRPFLAFHILPCPRPVVHYCLPPP